MPFQLAQDLNNIYIDLSYNNLFTFINVDVTKAPTVLASYSIDQQNILFSLSLGYTIIRNPKVIDFRA